MVKEKVRCSGVVQSTGLQCRKLTTDSSGFCNEHRLIINKDTEYQIQSCSRCQIRDCAYRGKAIKGLCHFELMDPTKDFDEKDKFLMAMQGLMKTEYLLKGRLEREISRRDFSNLGSQEDTTFELLKTWMNFNTTLAIHLERFGTFMGYEASESTDKSKEKKMDFMEQILNRDKKQREADKKKEEELKKAKELVTM